MTCRISLPLPFHNIKCRGNHAFFKVIRSAFNLNGFTFRLGYIFHHPLPSELNVCIVLYGAFSDIQNGGLVLLHLAKELVSGLEV